MTYDVVYDIVGFLREIYAYDVYIRNRIRYIIRYILPGAAAGAADRTGQAPAAPTALAS